jgi:hypothetical protein
MKYTENLNKENKLCKILKSCIIFLLNKRNIKVEKTI